MRTPFEEALGAAAEDLAPAVREHFLQPLGVRRYRGAMSRVWRRRGWRGSVVAPVLWLGSWFQMLPPDIGIDVPFDLEQVMEARGDGQVVMKWRRTFRFPGADRRFNDDIVFDRARGVLVDRIGCPGLIAADLFASVDQGAICLESGWPRLAPGSIQIPLPWPLGGRVRVREWEQADGSLAVRMVLSNPLLGQFMGYDGVYRLVAEV